MGAADRRHVLVYTSRVLPYSETFVADQARSLQRWVPVLVGRSRDPEGLDVDDLLADEMRLIGAGSVVGTALQKTTRRIRVLRDVFDRVRPALVHAHFLTGGFDAAASIPDLSTPLVVTAHGFDATWSGSPVTTRDPRQWLHGYLRYRLLRGPANFLAVSSFVRDELIKRGARPDRVIVHHTGVDTEYFTPGEPGDGPRGRILFVGRLVEKKGVVDLLTAVSRLRAEGVEAAVEVIGDGPQRSVLEDVARRDRLDVEFRGRQPRHEVRAAMRRASLLCAPSKASANGDREGFGMVLAEAQATGTPVVATSSGGIVDAVDHGRTGLLVPEAKPRALAEALASVLRDAELRSRLAAAARPWVLANRDLGKQSHQLERIFDSLVEPT